MSRYLIRLLVFFLLGAPVCNSAAAQSPEEIIERHIQSVGGKKPLKSIASTRYLGEVQGAGGTGSSFVWMMKAPHSLYLETYDADGAAIEAFNGRSAWRQDAANGLRTLTGREQVRARATALFRNDRFLNYKKDKTKVQLLGREAVAGRDAFAIRITTASGLQRKACFDTQTYLLLKEEQERDDGPEEILYADYRLVDGVMEPFRLTLRRSGRTLEVILRQVTHNVALADSVFDFPRQSDQALPDVGQLLLDVEKNQKQIDQLQELYTFNAAETQFEVDHKGNVRQKSENEYEVFYLGGQPYWKLVGKDGRKLPDGEARKEQEKAERFIREYEERKQKEERDRAKGKPKEQDEDEFGVMYALRELEDWQRIPRLPVYVDSPMAARVTDFYLAHREDHDLEFTRDATHDPLNAREVHMTRSVEASKQINKASFPCVILSASGMATGGRILHHLARRLPDSRNAVLLAGFQAEGTRGRALLEGARKLRIHGEDVPVKAEVVHLTQFSAHAGRSELLRWLRGFPAPPKQVFLVHGEPRAARALARTLRDELRWSVTLPDYQQFFDLSS